MKKQIISLLVLLLTINTVSSQDNDKWMTFLQKYTDGYHPDWYGKKMPAYSFSQKLNSDSLQGKIVVLDYWATWCSACRIYSKEFSEISGMDYYKDNLQIIGVNIEGDDTRKTGNNSPRTYWESKKYNYPMVDGKGAEESGKMVKNGFPTVILTDKKGIIRGRWDSYTPQVSDVIKLGAWVLSNEDIKFSPEQVASEIRLRNYYRALYISDQLPEEDVFVNFRLRAMLKVSEWDAAIYAKQVFEKSKNTISGEPYEDMLNNLCAEIVESNALSTDVNKVGLQIAEELETVFEGYSDDYIFLDYKGKLYWRTSQKEKARECAEKALQASINLKANPITIDYFKGLVDSYNKPEENVDQVSH